MDICHFKNVELVPTFQKFQGRVVFRGDIVKDDSGAYAVFTEQGSSASQMTAAKVMDVIARLPGCDGQTADAISAYTQVKMEDAHKLIKIPKSECPDIWIRLPRHKWPKSWSSMEDQVVPLVRHRADKRQKKKKTVNFVGQKRPKSNGFGGQSLFSAQVKMEDAPTLCSQIAQNPKGQNLLSECFLD